MIEELIEEYIKLLESFKEHQISKVIETIDAKILVALNSPKFSSLIAPYLKNRRAEGVPFTDFAEDPDNISQIKKLINALYHGRRAFHDLENINIRQWNRRVSDLKLLYSNTIHEAYLACYLLTHLDVDLRGIFDDEINILTPVFKKFEALSQHVGKERDMLTTTLKSYPLSYNAGLVSGIAVDQMKPSTGDIDFNFIAQFSVVLPGYLNEFSKYISPYSSKIMEKESTLTKAKILELQNAAYSVLSNLDNLRAQSVFAPVKLLNYIHIIRHTIILSMSILEQIGNVSESSQDFLREKLTTFKYSILATSFGLIDKIEDNMMLKPGTLSAPLMAQVKPLYELLIYYASMPIDFYAKGEELMSIEDSRFIALRLELTYKRINESNKVLIKVQKAQEALDRFFTIIEDPRFQNYTVRQLPLDIKQQLCNDYKLLKPYMTQVNIDLNNILIDSLRKSESWAGYLNRPFRRWVTGSVPADHLSHIRPLRGSLQSLITKNKRSQEFHIKLNEDLIESVQKQADLTLFPYNGENAFTIDESAALLPEHSKVNFAFKEGMIEDEHLDQLTSEQALDLYQWYRNKHDKFMLASKAYHEFIDLLEEEANKSGSEGKKLRISTLEAETLAKCRNLYNVIQPYFISGIDPENEKNAVTIDKYLSHLFSGKPTTPPDLTIEDLMQFSEHFQQYFTQIDRQWNLRSRTFLNLATRFFDKENEASELEKDPNAGKRAHHLIKHTNYSQFVSEFRKNLYQLISVLNEPMKEALKKKGFFNWFTLPFPELEDPNTTLQESKQVLAIKRIFNGLYHAEGVIRSLEKLNNKQSESKYVYHLLIGYGHINDIMAATKELCADPHFKLIGRELLDKAQSIWATIQEHTDAYQVAHEEVKDGETVSINSLWYVLNAFYISPKHIRTIRNNNYTTIKELDELHRDAKQSAVRIESIINSSSSYVKLFLQTPKMYALYTNLTNKLNEFTNTSHDAVMSNLGRFKSEIFTPMLIEADRWEDKLGLKPGLLSGPTKQIIDEYFKGLLNPLGLESQTHIQLVCDNQSLKKRQDRILNKINNANKQLRKHQKIYDQIDELDYQINQYLYFSEPNFPELLNQYKQALPKLVRLRKLIAVAPESTTVEEQNLDRDLNSSLNEYDPKFTDISHLVRRCLSYCKGVTATHQMRINTAREKLNYLTQLAAKQEPDNLLFVEQYTESSFNKQMEAYINRHLGLQFVHNEYRKRLSEYLLQFKETIIHESKTSKDINATVKNFIENHIRSFEKKHFATYYQLDTIRAALAQFTLYFSASNASVQNGTSTFESKRTLELKTKLINRLNDITETGQLSIKEFIRYFDTSKRPDQEKNDLILRLNQFSASGHLTIEELISQINKSSISESSKNNQVRTLIELAEQAKLSFKERIEYIRTEVEPAQFKGIILAHKQPDLFSLDFLKQCWFALLQALHLHTPAREKLFNSINEAVNQEPQYKELTSRFGLFAAVPEPAKEYELDTLSKTMVIEDTPSF